MIADRKHLLRVTGLDDEMLDALIKWKANGYAPFEKKTKRKDGTWKTRKLEPSKGLLKKVQKRLNGYIQREHAFPEYVQAGLKGKDAILNSKFHQGSKRFFTTDLKDFFPSVDNHMVYRALVQAGVGPSAARPLTELVTIDRHVPQGAPTSTVVTNLVFVAHAGRHIEQLIAGKSIRFTQYVDDITLSAETDFHEVKDKVLELLRKGGFRINHKKTKYGNKAEITGNDTSVNGIRPKQATLDKAKTASLGKREGVVGHIARVNAANEKPRRKTFVTRARPSA